MTEGTELAKQQDGTLIDPLSYFKDRERLLEVRRKEIQEFIHDTKRFVPGKDFTALPGVKKPVINQKTGEYVKDRGGKLVKTPCRMLTKPGSENCTTKFLLRVEQEKIRDHVTIGLIRMGYRGRIIDISGYFTGCGPGTVIAEREAYASSMEDKWRYRWVRVGPSPCDTRGMSKTERAVMIRKMLGDAAEDDAIYAEKPVEGEYCSCMRIDNENVLALEHDIAERAQKRLHSALVRIALNISGDFEDDMANPNELTHDNGPPGIAKTTYENDKPKRGRPPGNKNKPKAETPSDGAPGPMTEQEQRAITTEELFDSYKLTHNVGWTVLRRDIRDSINGDNITEAEVGFASELLKKNMPAAKAEATNGSLLG